MGLVFLYILRTKECLSLCNVRCDRVPNQSFVCKEVCVV